MLCNICIAYNLFSQRESEKLSLQFQSHGNNTTQPLFHVFLVYASRMLRLLIGTIMQLEAAGVRTTYHNQRMSVTVVNDDEISSDGSKFYDINQSSQDI